MKSGYRRLLRQGWLVAALAVGASHAQGASDQGYMMTGEQARPPRGPVRGQRPPHGPDLATFAVVTLLGVGSVMSGVNEARADSGVGGLSAIRRRASFLSVLIGLAAMFALGGALAHAGASQAVISVFEASAPVLVAGLFYLSTSIVQLNWPVAGLGVWLLAVAAAGGFAGPAGVWGSTRWLRVWHTC